MAHMKHLSSVLSTFTHAFFNDTNFGKGMYDDAFNGLYLTVAEKERNIYISVALQHTGKKKCSLM